MPAVNLPETTLSYELKGNGHPVLFIQGVGVKGQGWSPQTNALSSQFQTLSYDNRSVGNSVPCSGPIAIEAMAHDAKLLLDHIGWDSAHVVGHSMGGVIAQQLALTHPSRVRSLSLLCTFARGKDAARMTPGILWMGLRTNIGTKRMRRHAFLRLLYSDTYLRTQDLDALAERTGHILGRDLSEQPKVAMKQLMAMSKHDTSKQLFALSAIPTLVMSAAHDPIALTEYGRALAQAIRGAQLIEIANASHGVVMQEAPYVNERLKTFICECETQTRR